jgi:hypothetical protein
MEAYINQIKADLAEKLSACAQEAPALRRCSLAKRAVKKAIEDLQLYSQKNPSDPEFAGFYNRYWQPYFYGKLIYFTMCFDLESLKLTYSEGEKEELYKHKLKEVEAFFRRFSGFSQYYYRGDFSSEYFESLDYVDDYSVEDIDHLPQYPIGKTCLLAACLQANEQFRLYLRQELEPKPALSEADDLPKAIWKRSKTDLAEIIIALYEDHAIEVNGKPATFEYFKELAQREWGQSLDNLSIIDNKIRSRKKSTTPYLENLTRKSSEREDRLLGATK